MKLLLINIVNCQVGKGLLQTDKTEPITNKGKKFKILSIDGGGIRGVASSVILQEFEKKSGKPISELFDLVVGTSTGALLGGILSLPDEHNKTKPMITAEEATKVYVELGPKIFERSLWRNIKTLWGLLEPYYPSLDKHNALLKYVKGLKITDLLTNIVIPAFDTTEGAPYFFKSFSNDD